MRLGAQRFKDAVVLEHRSRDVGGACAVLHQAPAGETFGLTGFEFLEEGRPGVIDFSGAQVVDMDRTEPGGEGIEIRIETWSYQVGWIAVPADDDIGMICNFHDAFHVGDFLRPFAMDLEANLLIGFRGVLADDLQGLADLFERFLDGDFRGESIRANFHTAASELRRKVDEGFGLVDVLFHDRGADCMVFASAA